MNGNTFRTLEFDAIRGLLVSLAGSAPARERLQTLQPSTEARDVQDALELTSEAVHLLHDPGRQPYHDLPDAREILEAARVCGYHLEPHELREVASFAEGARDIARQVARVQKAPRLARRAAEIQDASELVTAIRRAILPTGEVADEASPRLGELRRTLARLKVQLHTVMEGYLRSRDAERVLQEKLVTIRNDRYVLLLKAEQRGQIPGVVHGSSGSGQSLFVEPLPALELNNDIVALADEERQEIVRILTDLTARVGARAAELQQAQLVLTELDAAQACARLAALMDAQAPELARGLELELLDARHPLLMPAVCAALGMPERTHGEPVPVTLRFGSEHPVLIVSGPNTGGKTVALKTLGLLALMAQSGLHVPAAKGSRLPVFRRVFADIGDDQSIAQNLSTFSAHLCAISEMARQLQHPALVLLDEVGGGTDPREGGPLGVAVVEHFRKAGAMVAASTHDGLMKAYAQATPGVTCGSFGYDPETYAPTYRLTLGQPGRSLALEMAERLGLPAEVVQDARSRLSHSEARAEALLAELERERALQAKERERLLAERQALEQEREEQRKAEGEILAQKRRDADAFLRDLRRRGDESVRKAAEAIHEAVKRVEESRRSASKAGDSARGEALQAIRQAQEEILHDPSVAAAAAPQAAALPLAVGARVRVRGLSLVGEIVALGAHGEAELAVAGKRMRLPQADLTVVAGPAGGGSRKAPRAVSAPARPEGMGALEVKLVGLRVDEALPLLDKALDDAALGDRTEVRVIHGFGEGKLRKAVAGFLDGHPHVAAFRLGQAGEGGAGATIVELRD